MSARQLRLGCLALYVLFFAALRIEASTEDYRVAAIIYRESGSRALIESGGGHQAWFGVGDSIGDGRIAAIEKRAVILATPAGDYELRLRGDPERVSAMADSVETPPPSPHQSRNYQVQSLLSKINDVRVEPGESFDEAVARNLNEVLGLGALARITSVGREPVTNPTEAREALQRQLVSPQGPVRLTVENDFIEDLYVILE